MIRSEIVKNKEEINLIRNKIGKLIQIKNDLVEENKYFSITRLQVLKGLCKSHKAKCNFAKYLSEKAYENSINENLDKNTKELFNDSLKLMEKILSSNKKSEKLFYPENSKKELYEMHNKLYKFQNEGRNGHYGAWIRSITNMNLLIVEEGLECFLKEDDERIGYEISKHYVEKYNPSYGTGIIPDSLPYLNDIIEFWKNYYKEFLEIQNTNKKPVKRVILKVEDIIIDLKKEELNEFIINYSKKDLKFKKEFINKFKKKYGTQH